MKKLGGIGPVYKEGLYTAMVRYDLTCLPEESGQAEAAASTERVQGSLVLIQGALELDINLVLRLEDGKHIHFRARPGINFGTHPDRYTVAPTA